MNTQAIELELRNTNRIYVETIVDQAMTIKDYKEELDYWKNAYLDKVTSAKAIEEMPPLPPVIEQ
jgi:hypothetical protein